MKKLLSILAAVGLTATASTSVVACTAKTVKKSITMSNTDMTTDNAQLDNEVRSAYDYVKTNNDIAKNIGGQAFDIAWSKQEDTWKEKDTAPLNSDLQLKPNAKDDHNKDSYDFAWKSVPLSADPKNTNSEYAKLQQDAEGVLIEVAKYTSVVNNQTITQYQLASANNFRTPIAAAKKGTLDISFISAIKLTMILNDDTQNGYIKRSDLLPKKGNNNAVQLSDVKYDPEKFTVADFVSIDHVQKDGRWEGDYGTMVANLAAALFNHKDNDKDLAYGEDSLSEKIYAAGSHNIELNITVGDKSTPTGYDQAVIKKYAL